MISGAHDATDYAFAYATDVGLVRERNEDNYLALPAASFFAVADGMGGHASGDVASSICVETIERFHLDPDLRAVVEASWVRVVAEHPDAATQHDLEDYALYKALEAANLAIFRAAQKHQKHRTMGTTVVACHILPGHVLVGHVGDSRLYRLREGSFSQLTQDHSLANEYLRLSLIQPEDLPRFAYKNVIVRALGLSDAVKVDVFRTDRQEHDRLLLCSDGLTDLVPDEAIADVLTSHETPEGAARQLVEYANRAGGHDNTTIIIIDLRQADGDA